MKINQTIFREYDIRGIVGRDLSEEFAYALGRAFAEKVLSEFKASTTPQIAVGNDCRLSSPTFAACLSQGLAEGGVQVILTGTGPTPQLYFSIFNYKYDGGIQVTGSHNPADQNGFKMCIGTHTLSGDEIQDLKHRINGLLASGTISSPTVKSAKILERLAEPDYTKMIVENCKAHIGKRKLKVVVDAGNGVGGISGPKILRDLGVEVIELYCEPDGRFPNHHPDPTVIENLTELRKRVIDTKADFGIGFDGDADRIAIVDEKGYPIYGDMITLLYAREILKVQPGAVVIGDVKCSQRLFDDVAKRGGKPIMWKTGHSLIKAKLLETKGAIAGEMSGHIMFKHRFYGFDDALYCAARFVEIVSQTDAKVSTFLSDLDPTVTTPEIRVDCPEEIKFKIPEAAKLAFPEYKIDTTDGVRVLFPKGWGLVRASNTQPILVMRFEASDQKHLAEYEKIVRERIEEIQAKLVA